MIPARLGPIVLLLGALSLSGCSPAPAAPVPAPLPSTVAPVPASAAPVPVPLAIAVAARAVTAPDGGLEVETVSPAEAEALLFPPELGARSDLGDCRAMGEARARIRCLIEKRYPEPEAAKAALALYEAGDAVAGLLPTEEMDGGFRGQLHLVPELPIGGHSRHLGWVLAAHEDFERFFSALRGKAPEPIRYRLRGLGYRFFRSHKRTTPSAYAQGWNIAYNVVGSLNTSASAVRETIFHEIFHLDDAAHGDWSARALEPAYARIVARCGTKPACLKPYTPTETMVRGGTYYAFQPGNGESVHEYGAELATRYYLEQRAALRGEAFGRKSFKCGPPENRAAWEGLMKEFFGGADLVPPCGG